MTRRSERVLWTAAFTGSIVAHAALAFAFALAPASEPPEQPETEIVFQPLPQATPDRPQRSDTLAMRSPAGEEASAFTAAPDEAVHARPGDMAGASPPDAASAASVAVEQTAGAAEETGAVAETAEPAVPASMVDTGGAVAAEVEGDARSAETADPQALANAVDATGTAIADSGRRDIAYEALTGDVAAAIAFDAATIAPSAPPLPVAPAASSAASPSAAVPGPVAASVPLAVALHQGDVVARSQQAISPDAVAADSVRGQTAASVVAPAPRAVVPPAATIAAETAQPAATVSPAATAFVSPLASAAPVAPGPHAVAVARPPDAPAPAPVPRQTPAQAYEALVGAIAGESGGGCFMALASSGGEGIGVDGFAAEADRLDRFGRQLDDAIELPLDMRRHSVSTPQCAALAFAGGLATYPEPVLSIELEAAAIASGGEIVGTVRNIARPWFYLLVIDDAGRVQEIDRDRLSETAPATMGFRVPLTLMDDTPETVQLLLAVASDEILEMVWLREGQQADIYFDDLRAEILSSGGGVDFGIAPFMLR